MELSKDPILYLYYIEQFIIYHCLVLSFSVLIHLPRPSPLQKFLLLSQVPLILSKAAASRRCHQGGGVVRTTDGRPSDIIFVVNYSVTRPPRAGMTNR